MRHALEGIPGYDHGVGRGSAAAPAPKPKAAPKATPKAAAIPGKFPPARAAKSAPWSPKAMPTEYGVKPKALDPRFAAERADALASCQGPIQQYGSRFGLNAAEANATIETEVLYDATMEMTPAPIKAHLARFDQMIASGTLSPEAAAFGRCVLSRRIAQLEGSPLIAGAVDGTLNPFSIGSPGTQWKQQGKDARVIASDGKSAMHCVKLEPIASGDSALSGGGRRFFNYCPEAVEIVWCHAPGDCYGPIGSAWTVRPNHGWPVSSKGYVRWAACLGANTASFVKGSYGLRYYCSAPAKTK